MRRKRIVGVNESDLTWHLLITRHIVAKNHFQFSFFSFAVTLKESSYVHYILFSGSRKSSICEMRSSFTIECFTSHKLGKKENNILFVLLFSFRSVTSEFIVDKICWIITE
jgi:hypothetical protein